MPEILLAEDDSKTIDVVRSVAASQGWSLKAAATTDEAKRAASESAPEILLVNLELSGAADLVRSLAHGQGGPGVIAFGKLGRSKDDKDLAGQVEAVLPKPLAADVLLETVHRALSNPKPKVMGSTPQGRLLSSEDIFGDLLDDLLDEPRTATTSEAAAQEVTESPADSEIPSEELPAPVVTSAEQEQAIAIEALPTVEPPKQVEVTAATPVRSTATAGNDMADLEEMVREEVTAWVDSVEIEDELSAPAFSQAVADLDGLLDSVRSAASADSDAFTEAAFQGSANEGDDDLEDRLDDTLSGVFAASWAAVASADASAEEDDSSAVDALLSKALSDLEIAAPRSEASRPPSEVSVASPPAAKRPKPKRQPSPAVTEAAKEFGDYRLEARIGVGGMAEVWKARRKGVEGFEKRVAIKRILPHAAENEEFVEMFIDEAKLAAQLNHSNITHIYDLGKLDGSYFIAMEYVEGKNLRQLLDLARKKQQTIPTAVALHIASRLAGALEYAHRSKDFDDAALGLVHRDVSPQNVLISFDGDIKLCDFGIAKAVSKISTTQMGALKGKLQYMSPEQAWGKPIDHRSDIYSLGTLTYEMLTGEKLFTGDSELSILEAVRESEIAPRIIQNPTIPAGAKGVLLKALAKTRDDRFESAAAFQDAVEQLIEGSDLAAASRELAALLRDVAEYHEEPITESSEEALSEIASDVLEPIPEESEWISQGAETDSEDEAEGERRTGWWRNLLTKIAPVVALVIFGAVAFSTLNRGPADQHDSSPVQVSDSAPLRVATTPSESVAEARSSDQEAQPPPESSSNAPLQTTTSQVDSAAEPEPSGAQGDTGESPDPERSSLGADNQEGREQDGSTAVSDAAAVDPDLERRVEADLQRVQTLMESEGGDAGAAPAQERNAQTGPPAEAGTGLEGQRDEIAEPGPGVVEPALQGFEPPAYPEELRAAGIQGTIRVSVLVGETGEVVDVRVLESLAEDIGLEAQVVEAARQARFVPATRDGIPAKMWQELTVRFEP